MNEREWDDAYDAQLEEMQEDWMAEKRGTGNAGYCPSCLGTCFVPVSVLGADTPRDAK